MTRRAPRRQWAYSPCLAGAVGIAAILSSAAEVRAQSTGDPQTGIGADAEDPTGQQVEEPALVAPDPPPDLPADIPIAQGGAIAGGGPVPLPPEAGPAAAPPPWSLRLGAGWGFEHNPSSSAGGESGSEVASADAFVDFAHRGRNTQLVFGAGGSAVGYRSDPDLNHYIGLGSFALASRLSRRTTFVLADRVDSTLTRDSDLLAGSGVLYEQERVTTNRATMGLAQQLGSRTSGTIDVRHEYVLFEDPLLETGQQLSGSVGLSHSYGSGQTIGTSYIVNVNRAAEEDFFNHTVLGSWSGRLGRRWRLSTALGGVRTSVGLWRPYAVAELNARLQQGTFSARASNTVSLAYGLGSERMMTTVGVAFSRRLSQRVTLALGASYNWSRDIITQTSEYDTSTGDASLRIELVRRLFLRVGGYYRYRRVVSGDLPDIQSGRFGAAFEYRAGGR